MAGDPHTTATQASRNLLVLGGGGHGRVVAEAAILSGSFARLVVVVDPNASEGWSFPACPCVSSEEEIAAHPREWDFVAAVGEPGIRRRLFETYRAKGFAPASVIHPKAIVSPSATIGEGVMILGGAVIATLARLGDAVIVNHNAVIEHDSEIADFAHAAPGSVLAGGAYLGEGSFLGSSASVRHGKRVGAGITIGNGAAVGGDIVEPGVYIGAPARLLRKLNSTREG